MEIRLIVEKKTTKTLIDPTHRRLWSRQRVLGRLLSRFRSTLSVCSCDSELMESGSRTSWLDTNSRLVILDECRNLSGRVWMWLRLRLSCFSRVRGDSESGRLAIWLLDRSSTSRPFKCRMRRSTFFSWMSLIYLFLKIKISMERNTEKCFRAFKATPFSFLFFVDNSRLWLLFKMRRLF